MQPSSRSVSWPISITFLGEAAVDTGGSKIDLVSGKFSNQAFISCSVTGYRYMGF